MSICLWIFFPTSWNTTIVMNNRAVSNQSTRGIDCITVKLVISKQNINANFFRQHFNLHKLRWGSGQCHFLIFLILPRKRIKSLQKRFTKANKVSTTPFCFRHIVLHPRQIIFDISVNNSCWSKCDFHSPYLRSLWCVHILPYKL